MSNIQGVYDSFSSQNHPISLSDQKSNGRREGKEEDLSMGRNQSSKLREGLNQLYCEKYSAENLEQQNSDQQFDIVNVGKLQEGLFHQQNFINKIGNFKNSIIEEEILSHISANPRKYEKLNFMMIQSYTQQRIQKMSKNKKIKKNWSDKDLKILVWIVAKFCQFHKIKDPYYGINQDQWEEISTLIPGATSQSCMFKWLGMKKSKVRDQKWLKEEQNLLKKLVHAYPDQVPWDSIAKRLFYESKTVYRCAKQCREHWNCFLNPKIRRGNWTKEEDLKLIKLILEGRLHKKWAKLMNEFDGRTENSLKNRYAFILEKQIKNHLYSKTTAEETILLTYLEHNEKEKQLQEKISLFHQSEESIKEKQQVETQKFTPKTKILDNQFDFLISQIQAQKQIHHIKNNSQLCNIMGKKIN